MATWQLELAIKDAAGKSFHYQTVEAASARQARSLAAQLFPQLKLQSEDVKLVVRKMRAEATITQTTFSITIQTKHPQLVIQQARIDLRRRGRHDLANGLLPGHFENGVLSFSNLSEIQFVAVEDVVARLGYSYEASQE